MREINQPNSKIELTRSSRINHALNAELVSEIENWLKSCWNLNYYPAKSLGEFVRYSLESYQRQDIQLDFSTRKSRGAKREITIRWTPPELLNFYYSLPNRKRTAIVELSLQVYYEKLKREFENPK